MQWVAGSRLDEAPLPVALATAARRPPAAQTWLGSGLGVRVRRRAGEAAPTAALADMVRVIVRVGV